VLVAQSPFDRHPPALGESVFAVTSSVAPSPPLVEASSPPTAPDPPDPEPEHPVGKKTVHTSKVTTANEASRRRSRPIRAKLAACQRIA
jgi:hypothetical protein